jgi:hypothetical protein
MPSNWPVNEMRMIARTATFNTAFTVADDASWAAGTSTTLRNIDEVDLSGLVMESVKDNTIQTYPDGHPANIDTIKSGSFSFKMHLEGGSSDTTAPTVATLMSYALGGLSTPAAITDACEASCTSTLINATAHGQAAGDFALIGAKDDSGGDGCALPIASVNSDDFTFEMALPAAPAESAVIKYGHTVYWDFTVERYIDFLFIGGHSGSGASDDPTQIQMIGCSVSGVELGGFAPNETPYVQFTFMVGNWQWVNYADQATISYTQTPSGNEPVTDQNGGQVLIQDAGTTTRNVVCGGDLSVSIPINLIPIRCPSNPNGIGGWKRVPSDEGVTMEISAYWPPRFCAWARAR